MSEKSLEEVEAENRNVLSLYTAIGRFMVEFSQLEFIIRHLLGEALGLKETGEGAQFDIVTSSYDFATLCRVTKAIFMRTMGCNDKEQAEIKSIMDDCMSFNFTERVPIAHGTWFIDESCSGTRHVNRDKLEMTLKYSKISDIDAAAQKAATLRSRLIKFIIGPIPSKATSEQSRKPVA